MEYGADKPLQVVAALDEIGRKAVEKLVITSWIGITEVVNGFDDPSADQVKPDPVDKALGEERIAGARQPGCQPGSAIGSLGIVENWPTERLRLHGLASSRLTDVARAGGVNDFLVWQTAFFPTDL